MYGFKFNLNNTEKYVKKIENDCTSINYLNLLNEDLKKKPNSIVEGVE